MNLKKCLKCCLVSIGAVIGAGFISGKEIMFFYARFSFFGYFLIFLSSILFGFISFLLLSFKLCENRYLTFFRIVCNFCLCSTMFAGLRSILENYISNKIISSGILVFVFLLVFIIINMNFSKITKVSSLLAGVMLLYVIITAIFYLSNIKTTGNISYVSPLKAIGGVYFAVNYVCFNVILAQESMIQFSDELNKKDKLFVCVVNSLILFVCLALILSVCLFVGDGLKSSDMPFIYSIIGRVPILKTASLIIIIMAIFTTIIAVMFAVKKYTNEKCKLNNKNVLALTLIAMFFISMFPFANLIEKVYPLIGLFAIMYYLIFSTKIPHKSKNAGNLKTI